MGNFLVRFLVIGLMVFFLNSCTTAGVTGPKTGVTGPKSGNAGYGPPPHAPAHGYRHKHQGAELIFDSGMGVYVVAGYPKHYFYNDSYYRLNDDIWEISISIGGPWVVIMDDDLPPGLRKIKKHKKKK